MTCSTDRKFKYNLSAPSGLGSCRSLSASSDLIRYLLRPGSQMKDPRHFLHFGGADVGGEDPEDEPLLPLEQGYLSLPSGTVDIAVLGGVQEVASLDRALEIGSEESSDSSFVLTASSVAPRC